MKTDSQRPDEPLARVVLYTRQGCHLCDNALALLRQHGIEPDIVDVDTDETLPERFDECIPVVEIDGKIRFRGHIDPILLRRLFPSSR